MIVPLLKGCYPYFSLIAIAVIIWRIRTKRWTAPETLVALALVLHIFLEFMQMLVGDGKFEMHRRYLLPVAPLFFIWTAYGIIELYQKFLLRKHKKMVIEGVLILVIFCLYDGIRPSLRHRFSKKKAIETQVSFLAGTWIRSDYDGPAQNSAIQHPDMYHSPFLPTVQSPFPAVAFVCGGRAEPSPFCDPPDYWVLSEITPAPEHAEEKCRFKAGKYHFVIYKRIAP